MCVWRILVPHLVKISGYAQLCSWESLLVVLRGPYGAGMKLRPSACEVCAQPMELYLWHRKGHFKNSYLLTQKCKGRRVLDYNKVKSFINEEIMNQMKRLYTS